MGFPRFIIISTWLCGYTTGTSDTFFGTLSNRNFYGSGSITVSIFYVISFWFITCDTIFRYINFGIINYCPHIISCVTDSIPSVKFIIIVSYQTYRFWNSNLVSCKEFFINITYFTTINVNSPITSFFSLDRLIRLNMVITVSYSIGYLGMNMAARNRFPYFIIFVTSNFGHHRITSNALSASFLLFISLTTISLG